MRITLDAARTAYQHLYDQDAMRLSLSPVKTIIENELVSSPVSQDDERVLVRRKELFDATIALAGVSNWSN